MMKRNEPQDIVDVERNSNIMRWTKRTAALLASLLLLSTVVQAREPAKAHAREILGVSPSETEEMPELIVVAPETAAPEMPELTVAAPRPAEGPETPAAVPETPAVRAALPGDREAGTPTFPEGEDWQLLLVNPWNEMPEDYEVRLKTMPDGMRVDERAYDDLNAMLDACREAGLSPKICSAYRTRETQERLYQNEVSAQMALGLSQEQAREEAGKAVALPGTSEHQLGLALDIVDVNDQHLDRSQEDTPVQRWLMAHSWEYGFILRYPGGKSDITGIIYEPWHYRYVGKEAAREIYESGLCLEEYLER